MRRSAALAVVFGSSAAVLVVEIIANRLMAPYVGVSLETFTGIIGVVLAGIAAGAAVGGRLADRFDPRLLLGPSLGVGGMLVWASVPIVQVVGPAAEPSPVWIVILTTLSFFLPCAVLSAATPIVAKLRLRDLAETGSVFGGLSAAGTVGGIAGTFLTGFVLVTVLGSRTTLFIVGLGLAAAGAALHWLLLRRPPGITAAGLALIAALSVFGFEPECDYETKYSCVSVDIDASEPTDRDLILDAARHGNMDLDEPTELEIRYVRLFADVIAAMPDGPIDVLHIGGGAFTVPRYIEAVRPGSTNHVLELDPGVVEIAKDELGLETSKRLTVRTGDARTALPDLPTDGYDLVVGDAFSGRSVPWHLTTVEVAREIDRLLRRGGIYVMNLIDGGESGFARAELATLDEAFDHLGLILPDPELPSRARNQVLIASAAPIPEISPARGDGVVVDDEWLDDYIGDAEVLTDDHAPVDQLADT
ncbi:MAG: fused MFS/spermidine synthase [Acidimicrobiales bacterium]|nr:fused MFS/spermidine synthase [Acidimicrobiales bacterium]